MEQKHNSKKTPITEEERLELAAKLDKELDEFINGLEKRQYTEGWPEDRWQEEFEKHPFFMKKAPEPGEALHPLLEGIQQLKYDPEENTAEELAVSYKEDGNFNFKHKNYRLAVLSYTEGIKQKHNNCDLIATLYNNRAAANYFLKNYRSCIRDCRQALKLKEDYFKVIIRAAQASFELNQWNECVEFCDKFLSKDSDKSLLELRQKAILAQKTTDRDTRRRKKIEIDKKDANNKLLYEIKRRGVKLASDNLTPSSPQLQDVSVHLNLETNELFWPVGLVYPEIGTIDFIREFSERNTFQEQLTAVLLEPASWDTEFQYKIDKINIYFEETDKSNNTKLHFVHLTDTLSQTLSRNEYIVKDATPHFILLIKDSNAEKSFLNRYK